ncbi:hypothetical protein FRC06_005221 [Ceratobasidium sp. 370]|nr:hypothetical protein FRC06_005221 [Ceratobasidium sp. 370]
MEVEIENLPPVAAPSLAPARKSPQRQVYVEDVEDEDALRSARKPHARQALLEEVDGEEAPPVAVPSPGPAAHKPPKRVLMEEDEGEDTPRTARKPPPRRVFTQEVDDGEGLQMARPSPGPPPSPHEPPPKRACAEVVEDKEDSPVAGPSRLANHSPDPTTSMGNSAGLGGSNGRMVNGLFVEDFPISTAGAPLGTRLMTEEDLHEYLQSCGRLGEPDLLETAEILLTTGLTGQGRTRHLKGLTVEGKGRVEEQRRPDE